MEQTRKLLMENKNSLETYNSFSDYTAIFEAIDKKVTPDNCIEACKSLLEGISKTVIETVNDSSDLMIENLDKAQIENVRQAKKQLGSNSIKFIFAFKQACTILDAHHHSFEKAFFDELGKTFCNIIGDIRNWKGDVSHGRVSPKPQKSTLQLANMVEQITDTLAFHMLETLCLVDLNPVEPISWDTLINESFTLKPDSQLELIDSEEMIIREFNAILDSDNPLEAKLSFSRALFEQYPEDYKTQLQEYITSEESTKSDLEKAEKDE